MENNVAKHSENEALAKSMEKFPLIFLYTYPTKKEKQWGEIFLTH